VDTCEPSSIIATLRRIGQRSAISRFLGRSRSFSGDLAPPYSADRLLQSVAQNCLRLKQSEGLPVISTRSFLPLDHARPVPRGHSFSIHPSGGTPLQNGALAIANPASNVKAHSDEAELRTIPELQRRKTTLCSMLPHCSPPTPDIKVHVLMIQDMPP
jgi:hypothetical protein